MDILVAESERMSDFITPETEGYERDTRRIMNTVLKEGDQFIIAGAHRGHYASVAASLVGATGKVYAFEPEPVNFDLLKLKMEPFENTKLFNFGLGNKNCTEKFFINSDNHGGHAFWDVSRNVNNIKTIAEKITITSEIKKLDDVLEDEDLSKLKLILFDMEGFEYHALKGAVNILADSNVPYIICEVNNDALHQCGVSQLVLKDFLRLCGYKAFLIHDYTGESPTEISSDKTIHAACGSTYVVFNVLFSRNGKV